MSDTPEMNCPSCGASYGLQEMNASGEVQCKFCCNRFLVPESIRAMEPTQFEVNVDTAPIAKYGRILIYSIVGFIALMVCMTIVPTRLGLAMGLVGMFIPFLVR